MGMEITVVIQKKEKKTPHGIEYPKKVTGTTLLITKINTGPFTEWNEKYPVHEVCESDRIVSVAGFQGKAVELAKKLDANQNFQVIVQRPAAEEHWWLFLFGVLLLVFCVFCCLVHAGGRVFLCWGAEFIRVEESSILVPSVPLPGSFFLLRCTA